MTATVRPNVVPRPADLARGAAVIRRSETLIAVGRALRATSLELQVRVRENRGASSISGGSDATDVVDVIIQGQTCLSCVMRKTGLTAVRVTEILMRLGQVMRVATETAACHSCHEKAVLYHI